jgi:CRP/FNR family transcriptional activator FtrB
MRARSAVSALLQTGHSAAICWEATVPQSDWDAARAIPLFAQVSEPNFRALRDATIVHRLPKNACLAKEGERPRFLHLLVDGSVEVFGCHNGQSATIDVKEPVSAITLAAVLRNSLALKSARTLSAARVLATPAEVVREAFRRDAAFARAAAEELADSYADTVRLLMNEKLRTSTERLAAWILCTCAAEGNTSFELKFNKRILASRLGMAPENLSRNLGILERHGVRTDGRDIVIENLQSLQAFAKPSALIDGIAANDESGIGAANAGAN